MRACSAVLLLCGCFSPRAPTGAPCDPTAPRCPAGQTCTAGGTCEPPGGDGGGDAAIADGAPGDAGPLAHIAVSAGWRVAVYQDFSADHAYVETEFVDGPETYSNLPSWLFALDAPFERRLAVLAGRQVVELTGAAVVAHDFGQHAPNTAGRPDDLRGATFVANLDQMGGALLVCSSSSNGGDGTFRITPAWAIAADNVQNNTRGILFDPAGAFDARGTAEGYLGTQGGLVRRSDDAIVVTGDTKTMRLVGSDLLVTRHLAASVRLIRIASQTHDETLLAEAAVIRLGEGTPPAPYLAWAIVDERALVLVGPTGQLTTVLASSDPGYAWQSVAAPAAPHPLAGSIYLLEGNRARDVDRVLAITPE